MSLASIHSENAGSHKCQSHTWHCCWKTLNTPWVHSLKGLGGNLGSRITALHEEVWRQTSLSWWKVSSVFPASAKQVSKTLERSSEGQTVEGRPGASKEWHVLPQRLKGTGWTSPVSRTSLETAWEQEPRELIAGYRGFVGGIWGTMLKRWVPSTWPGLLPCEWHQGGSGDEVITVTLLRPPSGDTVIPPGQTPLWSSALYHQSLMWGQSLYPENV